MHLLGSIFLALGISASFGGAAPSTVRTRVLHRSVFDLVGRKTDVRALCGAEQAIAVEYKRTAADVAAAVFTGWWYTPIHLRVTCGAP